MADLITLTDYKENKGITSTTNDDRYEALITQASEFIENYCNRRFLDYVTNPVTEWFDGATNVVYPTHFPIIEVVEAAISPDGGITQYVLEENHPDGLGFFVDKQTDCIRTQNMHVQFISPYSTPYRSLEVSYKAGYPSLPEDLKLATISLVDYYFDKEYTPSKSLAGANLDNQMPFATSSLPAHIRRVLDLYRSMI
jgi:hypothetical protein